MRRSGVIVDRGVGPRNARKGGRGTFHVIQELAPLARVS